MSASESPALVSIDWLKRHRQDQDVLVLDASMPAPGHAADNEPQTLLIRGAQVFDMDAIFCDPDASLPHMLPDSARFTRLVRQLGVCRHSQVVVYDNKGLFCAARAWWMFRLMGHQKVAVLEGGLPAWLAAQGPVCADDRETPAMGDFTAAEHSDAVAGVNDVLRASENNQALIIDARSAARFAGIEPEPRAGLRQGHIPGSVNLPYTELLEQGCLLPVPELHKRFQSLAVDDYARLIFSCGSGVTACIPLLAAWLCGYRNLALYDGSWSQWGRPGDLPVTPRG